MDLYNTVGFAQSPHQGDKLVWIIEITHVMSQLPEVRKKRPLKEYPE